MELLGADDDVVELVQVRQVVQHRVAVVVVLGARVVGQPEVAQRRQALQVADLAQVADLVLAYVQLLQPRAVLQVGQRPDLIHTGRFSSREYIISRFIELDRFFLSNKIKGTGSDLGGLCLDLALRFI